MAYKERKLNESKKRSFDKTNDMLAKILNKDGMILEFVDDQTEELCLIAVKQNPMALQFVNEQTFEMCLGAVKQNGSVLQYVKKQTNKICLEALKQNYYAYKFIKENKEHYRLNTIAWWIDFMRIACNSRCAHFRETFDLPESFPTKEEIEALVNIRESLVDVWKGEYLRA